MGKFEIRTDLALEQREDTERKIGRLPGVSVREWEPERKKLKITEVKVCGAEGAKALGKPEGSYITLEAAGLSGGDEDYHREIAKELSVQIQRLVGKRTDSLSLLVVGLGNQMVTPDALGPRVVGNLQVTRHLEKEYGTGKNGTGLSAIAPGVMAQTGMETAEIIEGVAGQIHPDLILAVDALAARSVHRLGTTIQLTDTGIQPGSGVGNHRRGLTKEHLGIPVLAIGVPTVVGAAAIVHDTVSALIKVLGENEGTRGTGAWIQNMDREEQYQLIRELLEPEFGPLYVTPPDIDRSIKQLSFTISEGIHQAFLPPDFWA